MESMVQEDGDWDSGDEGAGAPPAEAIHRGAAANGMHAEAAMSQYHECLRNHAAAAGGHVVDGCCEFMATSPEDPLACAACGCHRSFHRRDPSPGRSRAHLPLLAASARAPLALLPPPPAAASKNPHHQHQRPPFAYGPVPSGGTGTTTESSSEERRGPLAPAPRKRSRTTFTREQKEQMLAFAERVGWRMQRQDEAAVEHFCAHAGVRRQALKVWMHNNKQSSTAGRRQQQPQEEEKLQELRQEQQQ